MVMMREVSRDELLARRRELLTRLGVTLEELRARAEHQTLVGDEWFVWNELQEIAFLLGADDPERRG